MGQKYKVGDKVRIIRKTSYCGCGVKWFPTMDRWLGKIMTISAYEDGAYRMMESSWWWHPDWLESVAVIEIKESEENKMKLTGFKEAAKIIIGGKPYYYALYDSANVKEGDKVLVTGAASGMIHTVKEVVSAETALLETEQPLCAEVICKVDTSAYDARVKQRVQKAKLRKLMEATVAQMDEVDKFKVYAEHSPEMAKLLAQYNEINV